MCPLNKLFKIFYLSFLYFDFFLQIYDFNFELRLLVFVGLAHPGKAIIVQPVSYTHLDVYKRQTYPYADGYLTIYLCGSLFVMVSLGMNQFINAQGFGRKGMMLSLIHI